MTGEPAHAQPLAELRLCSVAELTEGEPFRVQLRGHDPFCVYLVEGEIYVSDNACTHGRASLGDEGELDGFNIICTWHDGSFDIRTGEVTSKPCVTPLKVYLASVRGGDVWISVAD